MAVGRGDHHGHDRHDVLTRQRAHTRTVRRVLVAAGWPTLHRGAAFVWRRGGDMATGPGVVAAGRGDHHGHDRDDVLTRRRADTGPACDVPVPLQR